jgi:arginase
VTSRRAPIPVQLVLVPYDTARRHWAMGAGPAHLLNHGLVEELEAAGHSVRVTIVDTPGDDLAEVRTAFALMTTISATVREARESGRFPLILAGNCNTAVGTVAGLDYADSIGVFWFDAHGDFNTPDTTLTGVLDGMALAMLNGRCWRSLCHAIVGFGPVREDATCLVGARDLDPLEAEALQSSELWQVGAAETAHRLPIVAKEIAARAAAAYLHVDLDVLDPVVGRVNRYSAPGGLTPDTLIESIGAVAAALPLQAAAITAYDPAFDADGTIQRVAARVVHAIVQ